jgi:hypothetical protein
MFRSPDQALAFAFRMRSSAVISIPSATYIANKTDNEHASDRLTQYDLHAQVGMIFSFLSRRSEEEQAYAFFLHGTNRERAIAANILVRRFGGRLEKYGISRRELRNAALGSSVRSTSSASGLSEHKAWKFRRELAEILSPIQDRLMDSLWEWLEASNTISMQHS